MSNFFLKYSKVSCKSFSTKYIYIVTWWDIHSISSVFGISGMLLSHLSRCFWRCFLKGCYVSVLGILGMLLSHFSRCFEGVFWKDFVPLISKLYTLFNILLIIFCILQYIFLFVLHVFTFKEKYIPVFFCYSRPF